MSQERAQFDRFLAAVLAQLAFKLDSDQTNVLYKHYELLFQWNRRMNLTAIRDPEKVVFRHFGESLAVAKLIGPGGGPVVDIGSGAGFPGAPVAACWHQRHVTLLESSGKKAIFLKEIARFRENLVVSEGRLDQFQMKVEWATMRGVAPGGIGGEVGRVAQMLALIIGATKAPEAANQLRLSDVKEHPVPWDSRTVILVGSLS